MGDEKEHSADGLFSITVESPVAETGASDVWGFERQVRSWDSDSGDEAGHRPIEELRVVIIVKMANENVGQRSTATFF